MARLASRHTTGGKKPEAPGYMTPIQTMVLNKPATTVSSTKTTANNKNTTVNNTNTNKTNTNSVTSNKVTTPSVTAPKVTAPVTSSNTVTPQNNSNVPNSSTQVSTPQSITPYTQSQMVIDAKNYLNSVLAKKPGQFSSPYELQMNELMDSILGREKFSYDLNTDVMYQQAKDQYTALGKLAMQDTMGQAAALTGGYGSSYASTAGNQAYQQYLQGLNDNIPEYYQMALDRYNAEGDELFNQYALASDRYNDEYAQYRDEMNDWYNDYSNAYNKYINEQDLDYNKFVNAQNLAYQREADAQNLAYQRERDAVADEQWKKEYETSLSYKGGSSSGGTSYSGLSDSNYELLDALSAGGENEAIDRWLTNWVESGKIDSATAQEIMDRYYVDDEEKKTTGNGKYTGAGLPTWPGLILNPDGSFR